MTGHPSVYCIAGVGKGKHRGSCSVTEWDTRPYRYHDTPSVEEDSGHLCITNLVLHSEDLGLAIHGAGKGAVTRYRGAFPFYLEMRKTDTG